MGLAAPESAGVQAQAEAMQRLASLRAEIDALFESVPFGTHEVGADGLYTSINDVELGWLGRHRDEVVGRLSPLDFLTPPSRDLLAAHCARHARLGFSDLELELLGAGSQTRPVSLHCLPQAGSTASRLSYRALLFDLSDPKRRQEQQRIAALTFDSGTGICITDAQGCIVRINLAFSALTGYEPAELMGRTLQMLSSGRRSRAFYEQLWAELLERGRWQGEVHDRRKDGSTFVGWLSLSAVGERHGQAVHYVAHLHDITAYKATQDEIRHMAFFDTLTELPNRRLLEDRLSQTLAATSRNGHHAAILFIDLDHFKSLNDTRGHAMGDQLLVEVARRLQSTLRDGDTVSRLGGDEFVVVLDGLAAEPRQAERAAAQVAAQLLAALAVPVPLGEVPHHTSASIGVSLIGGHESVSGLLQQSDLAMYEAKRAGRNTVRFFEPRMLQSANDEAAHAQALWRALQDGQFELHYQPQCDAQRRIVAAEALLRWQHPTLGLVAPGSFLAMAESTGLIVRIGHWVIASACRQLAAWSAHRAFAQLGLAVNVSARQFGEADFVDQVVRTVAEAGIEPSRLLLELTETTVHDVDDTRQKMEALRQFGLGFAMDDFGIGHSSLARLIHLPIRQLKIDRSFVHGMLDRRPARVVVDTILGMADSLEVEVLAEGVETEAQFAALRDAGCPLFQGYLVGPALPADRFESLLREGAAAKTRPG